MKKYILIGTLAVMTTASILIYMNKSNSNTDDIEQISQYIITKINGDNVKLPSLQNIDKGVADYLANFDTTMTEKYKGIIDMDTKEEIYRSSKGTSFSESAEDEAEPNTDYSDEELKEILGEDYEVSLRPEGEEYTEQLPDDTRLEIINGRHVIHTKDLRFNEYNQDYITYKNTTHIIDKEAVQKSYEEMHHNPDYTFFYTDKKEYRTNKRVNYDILYTSITGKNNMVMKVTKVKEKISNVEVVIIEN